MVEFIQIEPFIWAVIIIGSLGFAWWRISDIIKVKIKSVSTSRNYSGDKNIDGQLDNFINNAPRLLAEIHTEIQNQKKEGVSDQQMKGLIQKEGMLSFIVQNKEIIDIIGKPILRKLVGFIKAI